MHSNLFQATSKITYLARSGCITNARKLFDEMPYRDTVAWNSMLTGYSHLGFHQETLSLFYQLRISNVKPDNFTFTAAIKACASTSSFRIGTKVHSLVIVSGYQNSLPVNNSLIDMYGKCLNPCSAGKVFGEMTETNEVSWCSLLFAYTNSGQFDEATRVFQLMPKKIDVSWNIIITALGRYGEIELCFDHFREMRMSLCEPDQWTYSSLISSCAASFELLYGSMMHAIVIKSGWSSAVEVKNSVLSWYAKLGSLDDALKVFDSTETLTPVSWNALIDAYMKAGNTNEAFLVFQRMPEKNVVSWTSMITGCASNGQEQEALRLFVGMIRNSLPPDNFSLGAALHACSSLAVLGHGRMVHGCVIRSGFHAYTYIGNSLVNMYGKCGNLDGSVLAFDEIYEKDSVSFNAMLFAFGLHGDAPRALQLYEQMVGSSGTAKPDKVTFIGLLMACSHSGLVEKGGELFESMVSNHKISREADHVACMVDMLGRGGYLAEAEEVATEYSEASDAKAISTEALLRGCSVHGEVGMGACAGDALKALEPDRETSYLVQSNVYSSTGQWREAEMVRRAMRNEGVKKTPGCSWIEVRNELRVFVAGNNRSHSEMEVLCELLHFLELEMRSPSFVNTLFRT